MKKNIIFGLIIIILIGAAIFPYLNGFDISSFFNKEESHEIPEPDSEFPDKDFILQSNLNLAQEDDRAKRELWAKEMRAVWIPYLSLKNVNKEKIDEIIINSKEYGINTIIFHVRPFGDALYNSAIFPWSHLVSETQGTAPADDFDPLAYAVKACHENDMKIHAWVNPLRIQSNGTTPPALSENNPANKWMAEEDTRVITHNGSVYYNPASKDVRDLIAAGVGEIVEKYEVDGVQFDDYFYPAENESFSDGADYKKYTDDGGKLSLKEWRQSNISSLIKQVYDTVKEKRETAVFGISPAGNIDNCLKLGANVKQWCSEEGYIDYICPQIYWTFGNSSMPFDTVVKNWQEIVTNKNVKMYAGLALYKAGSDSDDGTWLQSSDNLKRQVERLREESSGYNGFMLYSYEYLKNEQCTKELEEFMKV